jgi:hypothetical protein
MNTPSIAYWPVACDLSVLMFGYITIGRETRIACDGVIEHSSKFEITDYVILPSAGISPDLNHRDLPMSHIMRGYFQEKGILNENLEPLIGKTFNTQGEARAIAEYLQMHPEIEQVVISVKWWHALRCYAWLYLYLKKFRLDERVTVEILPLQSEVAVSDILREFWKANPFNLIRMLKVRYIE